jgi:hypothetical protein
MAENIQHSTSGIDWRRSPETPLRTWGPGTPNLRVMRDICNVWGIGARVLARRGKVPAAPRLAGSMVYLL